MVCRTWSQPDANHWRPLCTNTFQREGFANGCVVCAFPYAWDHCTQCAGGSPYRYRIVEGEITATGPDLLITDETVVTVPLFFGGESIWHYRRHEFGWSTIADLFENSVIYPISNPEADYCEWEITAVSEIGWRFGECLPGPLVPPAFAWSRYYSYDQFLVQDRYSTHTPKPTTKYTWPTGFGAKTDQPFTSGTTGVLIAAAPAPVEYFQAVASRCEFQLRATFFENRMRVLAAVTEQSLIYGFTTGSTGYPSFCSNPDNAPLATFNAISSGYPTRQLDAGESGAIWDSEELGGCLDLSEITLTKTRGASEWPSEIVLKASLW